MSNQWIIRRVLFAAAVFGIVFALVVALLLPQLQRLLSAPKAAHATASTPSNFHIYAGVGTLNATVPFNTDALFDSTHLMTDGTIFFRITKPDSSTVDFQQNTDSEGRIRGQLFNTIIDQTGTYTLTVQGPPAIAGVSDTFTVGAWAPAP